MEAGSWTLVFIGFPATSIWTDLYGTDELFKLLSPGMETYSTPSLMAQLEQQIMDQSHNTTPFLNECCMFLLHCAFEY